MTKQKLNVLTLAVNERMRNILELFFAHHCQGLYQLIKNKEQANLIIADLDDYDKHYSLNDLINEFSYLPIIIISIKEISKEIPEEESDRIFFLRKPLILQQLKDTLSNCSQSVNNKDNYIKKKAHSQIDIKNIAPTVVHTNKTSSITDKPAKSTTKKEKNTIDFNHGLFLDVTDHNTDSPPTKKHEKKSTYTQIKTNHTSKQFDPKQNNSLSNQETARTPTQPVNNHFSKREKKPSEPLANTKTASAEPITKPNKLKKQKNTNSKTEEDEQKSLPFIGFREDIDLNDKEMLEKISFCPEKYIYYHLNQLIQNKREANILYVNIANEADFFVSANSRFIKTTSLPTKRRAVASYYFEDVEIEVKKSTLSWDEIEGTLIPSDTLLWELSLWAARGRLPVDTDIARPIKLRHWPNMTQYEVFPYAVKMAAIWSKHTLSIKEIIEKFKIPQRYVFSFYVANQAIGMLDFNKIIEPIHVTEAEVKVANKRVSIFRRILAHITN